jgi:hypothetical protein
MSKHPELNDVILAYGVSYACAYMRLEHGWSLERAVNTPVHKRRAPLTKEERHALYEARRDRIAKQAERRDQRYLPKPPKKPRGHPVQDTSPKTIKKIRAAFCNEFIKTGNINENLQQKLKEYANECRAANERPSGVSAEPTPRDRGRAAPNGRDDRRRTHAQVDDATAGRIANLLRV